MSEIEKMFENANAYKMLCNCEFKNLFDYSIDYGQDVCIHVEDEIRKGCEGCELAEQNVKYYPLFTAEKQLELIKWLSHKYILHINYIDIKEFGYCLALGMSMEIIFSGKSLADALANLINALWEKLSEEEKKQIKDILNG